jgi:hypothetical protein
MLIERSNAWVKIDSVQQTCGSVAAADTETIA